MITPFQLLSPKPAAKIFIACWLAVVALSSASPARAAESPTQAELPPPWVFVSPDSISFAVMRANPDDEGVRSLLDTAWKSIKASKGSATGGFTGLLLKAIQGDDGNGLMSFLPLQLVRSDTMDAATGQPHPTIAVTVSGWRGLQMPLYFMMSRDKNGKAYPTKDLEDATLVLREGWQDPTRSHVLTRIKGTFVSFPTIDKAKSCVTQLASKAPARPKGTLAELLDGLDASRDTYGVLLNRQGSLLKFLSWLNRQDVAHAQSVVGVQRMNEVVSTISSMTWEGDLISDNEIAFSLVFRTESPDARRKVADLLKDVREVLNSYGRAGEMRTTGLGSELHVEFDMVGYKDMLESYIHRSF